MGEASRKRGFFWNAAKEKFCIYCAGMAEATQVDHMPPRALFTDKQRPKGLEFPTCAVCNKNSAKSEQVIALFSRLLSMPGDRTDDAYTDRLWMSIGRNHPDLLTELLPNKRQILAGMSLLSKLPGAAGVMNAGGPILNRAMQEFGAKLGLALHYHETGRIVPPHGAVFVRWYSNVDLVEGKIPDAVTNIHGVPYTLRQGKKHVEPQFTYSIKCIDDRSKSLSYCTFRLSFAIVVAVEEAVDVFGDAPADCLHRPGLFKTYRSK